MKTKTYIKDIMHFLVHNGFLVTVAVMCMVHATLLFIFWMNGVIPLIQLNTLSVIVYAFCFLLIKYGHVMPVYISIIIEVTAYTIISTYYVGLRCGTYCFLFSIVTIIIYFGCFLFKGNERWLIVLLLVFNFGSYIWLYLNFSDKPPVIDVSPATRTTLVIFSSFVMVFATIFYCAIYIYASEMEVVSLEERNKQLSVDASEDALTSLFNRRGFLPIVASLMGTEQINHFCIAFLDIDNFKRINDSYGHDCGDEVLRHITGIIKKEMTGCEICRWGGEEIVILMRDYDKEVAKTKMEYIRKNIESSPTIFFNQRIPATVTIGLAENNEKYKLPDDIIKAADDRMYYGKQHGKNILIFQ